MENPYVLISQTLEDAGYFAPFTSFKTEPSGREWIFTVRIGDQAKKVEYFGRQQQLRISEIKWFRAHNSVILPVQNQNQVEDAIRVILNL